MKFFSIMGSIADNDIKYLRDNLESTLNIQINDKEIDELLLLDDTKILDAVWDLTYKKYDPPLRSFKTNGIEIELDKINDDFKNHVMFSSFYSMKCSSNKKENFICNDIYIYCRYFSDDPVGSLENHYKNSSKLWCKVSRDLVNLMDHENLLCYILRGDIIFEKNQYKMDILSKEIFYAIIENWRKCPYNPIFDVGIDFKHLRSFSEKVMGKFSNRLAGIIRKRHTKIKLKDRLKKSDKKPWEVPIKEFAEYSLAGKLIHYYISERLFHFSLFYNLLQIPIKYKSMTSTELDSDTIKKIIDVLTEIKDIPCVFSIDKFISNMLNLYYNDFKQDFYKWKLYAQININYLSKCVFPVYESTYYVILLIYINKKQNSLKLDSNKQEVISDKILMMLEDYVENNMQPDHYEKQMEVFQESKIKENNKFLHDLTLATTHKLYNQRMDDKIIFNYKNIERFSQKLFSKKNLNDYLAKVIGLKYEIIDRNKIDHNGQIPMTRESSTSEYRTLMNVKLTREVSDDEDD